MQEFVDSKKILELDCFHFAATGIFRETVTGIQCFGVFVPV